MILVNSDVMEAVCAVGDAKLPENVNELLSAINLKFLTARLPERNIGSVMTSY